MVAPGELILVSDGQGGVTRQIGTSFAAPLVSGAIALLHDRWPWLSNFPVETANIILNSAKDLGAPGVDAVYGHGLLDVDRLAVAARFQQADLVHASRTARRSCRSSKAIVLRPTRTSSQATLGRQGRLLLRLRAARPADPARLRHPAVAPSWSARRVTSLGGTQEQFQGYLRRPHGRLGGLRSTKAPDASGFNGFTSVSVPVANRLGRRHDAVLRPAREARTATRRASGLPVGPAHRGRARLDGGRLRRRRPGAGRRPASSRPPTTTPSAAGPTRCWAWPRAAATPAGATA